jgi:hypothetical protein
MCVLNHLIHWLAATSASEFIQRIFWIVPAVQIVHILAIAVVLSSMAIFDLRLLGIAGTRNSIAALSLRFMPWLWVALSVLLISGSILIVGEPQRSLGNVFFQLKMSMLATAIIVTIGFQVLLKRDLARGASDLRPEHCTAAKVTGLVSLLLWVGIVAAGRLIAYAA